MLTTAAVSRTTSARTRAIVTTILHRRSFFASSTDHTRLLKESEIHCLPQTRGNNLYVLAAGGMDKDVVQKVPQLHLARIYLDGNKIYGAKVVNKTLGDIPHVCGRLLDAAMKNGGTEAHSTLHGLSEWVLKRDENPELITEICNGSMANYDAAAWEPLALDFAQSGLAEEANLYLAKEAAKLIRIEHQADETEFANTSGGAMAIISLA